MGTNGKKDTSDKIGRIGIILTVSIALGGVYGNVNDRISAVETSQVVTQSECDNTQKTIEEQSKMLRVIQENTIEIKSDLKLLKATKADKKLVD